MTAHALILGSHITCGVVALSLGLVAMCATKQRGLHTLVGNLYHWVYLALAASACGVAATDWSRLWWYVPIALGSYALALNGFLAAKLRWNGWMESHLTGQLGSYIAMTTAVLVVNAGSVWWAWITPTVIGSPIIAWLKSEVRAGRRPRYPNATSARNRVEQEVASSN